MLGTWPGRNRSDAEKRQLAREVARLARVEGKRVLLVFDGPEPYTLGSDVMFAGPGRTADDVILAILAETDDPRGWTVVTNDKSLGDQSRWLEARVERCEVFRRRLEREDGSDKPKAAGSVDEWLRIFGEERED